MALHVVGYVATATYLLVKVPKKNTAAYVFTDTTNLSGWDSSGVSIQSEKRVPVGWAFPSSHLYVALIANTGTGCMAHRPAHARHWFGQLG